MINMFFASITKYMYVCRRAMFSFSFFFSYFFFMLFVVVSLTCSAQRNALEPAIYTKPKQMAGSQQHANCN